MDNISTEDSNLGLLEALILGHRANINNSVYVAFSRTGLLHFISLSGLHVGILSGIQVYLTSLGGGASTVTVRLCEDAAGDVIIVPDTTATLATGLTTATTGNAMFRVDLPLRQDLGGPGNGELYLFVHVDAGSAVFTGSQLLWME